jgi:hypothetical protein
MAGCEAVFNRVNPVKFRRKDFIKSYLTGLHPISAFCLFSFPNGLPCLAIASLTIIALAKLVSDGGSLQPNRLAINLEFITKKSKK